MTLETIYIAILSGTAFVSLGLALTLYNRTNIVADTLPFKILRRSKLLAGNISMATTFLSLILLSVDVTKGDSGIKCMMLSFFYLMGIQWVWMVIPLIAPDFLTKKKVIRDASVFISSTILVNLITNGIGYDNKFVGITFAFIFITHCGLWVVKFGKLYRRAMFNLEEEFSDYVFLYIEWTYDASLAVIVFCLSGVLLCYSEKMTIAIFFFFAALAYFYVVQSLNKYQIHAERLYFGLKKTEEEKAKEVSRKNSFICNPSINVEKTTKTEEYDNVTSTKIEKNAFGEESPIAQRIKKWIDEEGYLQPGLTLNDIANKIGTNRTYVSGFINTTYRSTFFEFIANLRVEKIKKLLTENPDRELEYLSNTCGFSSSSHMSSTFKKITGETLNEFRKRIKNSMEE